MFVPARSEAEYRKFGNVFVPLSYDEKTADVTCESRWRPGSRPARARAFRLILGVVGTSTPFGRSICNLVNHPDRHATEARVAPTELIAAEIKILADSGEIRSSFDCLAHDERWPSLESEDQAEVDDGIVGSAPGQEDRD